MDIVAALLQPSNVRSILALLACLGMVPLAAAALLGHVKAARLLGAVGAFALAVLADNWFVYSLTVPLLGTFVTRASFMRDIVAGIVNVRPSSHRPDNAGR